MLTGIVAHINCTGILILSRDFIWVPSWGTHFLFPVFFNMVSLWLDARAHTHTLITLKTNRWGSCYFGFKYKWPPPRNKDLSYTKFHISMWLIVLQNFYSNRTKTVINQHDFQLWWCYNIKLQQNREISALGLACNAYNGILSFGLTRARSGFIDSSKTQLTVTRWPGCTHVVLK